MKSATQPTKLRTSTKAAAALASLGLLAGGLVATVPAQAAPSGTALAPAVAPAVAPSALTVAAATKATTVSVPFTWADGKAIKATVVTKSNAKVYAASSLGSYRIGTVQWSGSEGVLPDGRVVGVHAGKVKVQEKNGKLRNYYSGSFSPRLDAAVVQGSTVLGVAFQGKTTAVYVFKGTGSKPSSRTVIPGQTYPVLLNGRVYFNAGVNEYKVGGTVHLRSVKVGGTKSSLVAKNAGVASLSGKGLAYYTLTPAKKAGYGPNTTGLRSLTTGKTLIKYTGKSWPASKGQNESDAHMVTGAGADVVAIDNVGRNGQLVLNLKTKKAWLVTPPSGAVAIPASVSGTRLAWTWAKPQDWRNPGVKEIATFDAATGKYTIYTSKNLAYMANVNGKAMEYSVFGEGGAYPTSYGSGILR